MVRHECMAVSAWLGLMGCRSRQLLKWPLIIFPSEHNTWHLYSSTLSGHSIKCQARVTFQGTSSGGPLLKEGIVSMTLYTLNSSAVDSIARSWTMFIDLAMNINSALCLRWRGSLSAGLTKANPGLQSGPGLLLVSGLGFGLGQPCFA